MQNKRKEIEHNLKIKDEAEFLWGWVTPAGRLRAKRRAEIIIDRLKQQNLKKVLEIGSGTGVFTEFFCQEEFDLSGIDISWDLLKKTQTRCLTNTGKRPKLITADVENMPFRDNDFDAVVGICVLHHFNIIPALKEIRRVLKKGGMILFSEPNMLNPQLMLQKNIKPIKRIHMLGETEDETAFFKWKIKKLLENLSFKEISVVPFDFLHPWTPEFAIPFVKKIGSYLENIPILREIAGSLLICAAK